MTREWRGNWNAMKGKQRISKPGWIMDGSWHECDKDLNRPVCGICWHPVNWYVFEDRLADRNYIVFEAKCCGVTYTATAEPNWYIETDPKVIHMDDTIFPIPE